MTFSARTVLMVNTLGCIDEAVALAILGVCIYLGYQEWSRLLLLMGLLTLALSLTINARRTPISLNTLRHAAFANAGWVIGFFAEFSDWRTAWSTCSVHRDVRRCGSWCLAVGVLLSEPILESSRMTNSSADASYTMWGPLLFWDSPSRA